MIPKKHAPDLIRGVQRFSEKIMLKQEHDPEKACPGLDPGCAAVCGRDHAQTRSWSGMTIQRKVIPLWCAIVGQADRSGWVILGGDASPRAGSPVFDRKRREFIPRLAAPQERGRKPIHCCIATAQGREARP
jgi:hypothetical protein